MTVTLGQVRDWHRGWLAVFPVSGTAHKEMADAIDAHMAAVREVIAELRSPATVFLGEPANEVSKGWADKLEAAIKGVSHG